MPQNRLTTLRAIIFVIITMLLRLAPRLRFLYRTHEQTTFLDSLAKMRFTSDEQLIANVRALYDKRVPHR